MNAKEIRRWADLDWSEERKFSEGVIEIAAQLAEMNEHLASIANPPIVNEESRWVWLKLGDGVYQVFDREKITCVTRRGDRLTVINDNWNHEHTIFMPIEEVCGKLKIPLPG